MVNDPCSARRLHSGPRLMRSLQASASDSASLSVKPAPLPLDPLSPPRKPPTPAPPSRYSKNVSPHSEAQKRRRRARGVEKASRGARPRQIAAYGGSGPVPGGEGTKPARSSAGRAWPIPAGRLRLRLTGRARQVQLLGRCCGLQGIASIARVEVDRATRAEHEEQILLSMRLWPHHSVGPRIIHVLKFDLAAYGVRIGMRSSRSQQQAAIEQECLYGARHRLSGPCQQSAVACVVVDLKDDVGVSITGLIPLLP